MIAAFLLTSKKDRKNNKKTIYIHVTSTFTIEESGGE